MNLLTLTRKSVIINIIKKPRSMKFTKRYWMRRNGVSITSVGQKREARLECKRIYIYSIPYSTENRPVGGNNSETVYDYTDGLTLNIFALKDKAETVVYDNKGTSH